MKNWEIIHLVPFGLEDEVANRNNDVVEDNNSWDEAGYSSEGKEQIGWGERKVYEPEEGVLLVAHFWEIIPKNYYRKWRIIRTGHTTDALLCASRGHSAETARPIE